MNSYENPKITGTALVNSSLGANPNEPPPQTPPSPKAEAPVSEKPAPQDDNDPLLECLRAMAQSQELNSDRDKALEASIAEHDKLIRPLLSRVDDLEARERILVDQIDALRGRVRANEMQPPPPSPRRPRLSRWRILILALIVAAILAGIGWALISQHAEIQKLRSDDIKYDKAFRAIIHYLEEHPAP
ncbi:MAG: hypothetical protein ABSA05_03070 [Opitutaceae bacterium]|jgi:hypothetical protein